jgi:hypothetical protein
MKLIVALLIACLVVVGFPSVVPAQVVTDDGGESDNSGGSEANNTSYILLGAAIAVAFAAAWYMSSSKPSIAKAKQSPLLLVAATDYDDNVVYDAGDVFSAGLAYRTDF